MGHRVYWYVSISVSEGLAASVFGIVIWLCSGSGQQIVSRRRWVVKRKSVILYELVFRVDEGDGDWEHYQELMN